MGEGIRGAVRSTKYKSHSRRPFERQSCKEEEKDEEEEEQNIKKNKDEEVIRPEP